MVASIMITGIARHKVKGKVIPALIKHHDKKYGGVEIQLHHS
jgi:hypothetical protein